MTWTTANAQIRSGHVVPIAVSSNARLPEFPDLPTFKELGYPDLVTTTWYALSGPVGLPSEITGKLNAAVAKILTDPEVRRRYERDAIEVRPMTSEEITNYMASEIEKWAPIAKRIAQ
jgi:tripartite-type tricarboxylate transporter receptor subunit TctC